MTILDVIAILMMASSAFVPIYYVWINHKYKYQMRILQDAFDLTAKECLELRKENQAHIRAGDIYRNIITNLSMENQVYSDNLKVLRKKEKASMLITNERLARVKEKK